MKLSTSPLILSRVTSPIRSIARAAVMPLLISPMAAQNAYAEVEEGTVITQTILITIVVLLALQTLLIIGLQRSRLKNKGARNTLRIQQKNLEEKIQERTQNLYQNKIELETAIEDQKIIALQLLDTKRHLQTMINSVPDILVGISADEKVTYWNTAAFEKTGVSFDKALGTPIFKALPQLPITPKQLTHIIKHEQPFINQRMQHTENSEQQFFDLRIYPLMSEQNSGAVIQLKNVTKQVHVENMMIQNEKMSSLGELAAGIAHEINNPLGVILHNVQNIIRRTSNELPNNIAAADQLHIKFDDIRQYLQTREVNLFLDNIKAAGERAGSIVSNMLEFSRTSHNEKTWVDIKKLVSQAIELNIKEGFADQQRVNRINVSTHFSAELPLVYCSASELQQVLLNLLRNAYQALTSDNYPQEELLKVNISASFHRAMNEIQIEVSDNGPGIKDSIKDHIFEPFFTTKEVGKGTGLGLSVSYFIITEHHQGTISVSSLTGKGATFKICLPVLEKQQYSFDI